MVCGDTGVDGEMCLQQKCDSLSIFIMRGLTVCSSILLDYAFIS